MGPRLSIYSLGMLEVEADGRSLPGVSGGKMSALLMLLAMRPGHRSSRDTLGDMLWPSMPIQSARKNLRHTFFHLREALGESDTEPFLLFGRDWLGFNARSDFWLDARELAAAEPKAATEVAPIERLAALYRGEFMAGFSLPDCQDFEGWLQAQREDLRRRATALLEHLVGHHEANGGGERGLELARRLLALDPLNETFHRGIMRLCASMGRPGAAQAQYDACKAVLWRELEAQPSVATTALLRQILLAAETRSSGAQNVARDGPVPLGPPTDRRQVTVLYGELRLADADEVDEAAEQLRGPQRRCADIIRGHGGYLSPFHGGGLLAYFGYPDAREDAARRAVAAAQAMCEAAGPATLRCGVHTGLIATSPGLPAPDLVGTVSEQAIQLRLGAGEQGVALSRETYRLVEGHVRCLPLGPRSLVDGARPVEVFRVEGPTGAPHRPAPTAPSPFVGRAADMQRLSATWRQVCAGRPTAVLVRGDPGIGKSRLVTELRGRIAPEGTCRSSFCLPEHQGTPFFPFAGLLRVVASPSAPGTSPEAQEAHRRQLLAAMQEALLEPASRDPLLVLVEDVQWADSSTLELLRLLIAQLKTERALILLTSRPEFGPPWWPPPGGLTLELKHLPEEEARQLAKALSAGVLEEELERIVAQSDGVPLFIEELALWQGARGPSDRAASKIPATLHDLLMARVDQLGEARRLAQVGATCGRSFEAKLAAAVLKEGEAELENGVQALLRSGLVLAKKNLLQFKHALIQAAAYESQPRSLRRETHRRIAAVLQRDDPGHRRNRPETLAHHLTEAGEIEPAIRLWRAAGAAATLSWSHREAVLHLRKALDLVARLAPSREREKLELSLRVELGTQLIPATGYGGAEVKECYARAYALCRESDDAGQIFLVVFGQWMNAATLTGYLDADKVADRLDRLAQMSERAEFALAAHCARAETLFRMGRFADVAPRVEAAEALCRRIDLDAFIRLFGVHPRAYSLVYLALSRWFLGYPAEALGLAQEALDAAAQFGHVVSQCIVLVTLACLEYGWKRPRKVLDHCEALGSLERAHGMRVWSSSAKCFRAWVLACQGDAQGAALLAEGLEDVRKHLPGHEIVLGELQLETLVALGLNDQVLAEVEVLLETAVRRGEGFITPELHRVKGAALLAAGLARRGGAEACFREALEQARRSGARLLELRAAASLFRLRRDRASRELLAELAAAFDEETDHPDILEARKLAAADAAAT